MIPPAAYGTLHRGYCITMGKFQSKGFLVDVIHVSQWLGNLFWMGRVISHLGYEYTVNWAVEHQVVDAAGTVHRPGAIVAIRVCLCPSLSLIFIEGKVKCRIIRIDLNFIF